MSLGQNNAVLLKKKIGSKIDFIGSGVIYYIPNESYFYVLTAKHCICNKFGNTCKKNCDNCNRPDITKSKLRINYNIPDLVECRVKDIDFLDTDFAVLIIENINRYIFEQVKIRNYNDERDLIAYGFPKISNNRWKKIELKQAELNNNTKKLDCFLGLDSTFNINQGQAVNISGLSGAGVYIDINNIKKLVGIYIETTESDNQGYVLPYNEEINKKLSVKNYKPIIPEEYSDELKRQINEQFLNCFEKINEIGLTNENHLKTYCLKLQNSMFKYDTLKKALKENIRHFTLSREQVRTYRKEDRLSELIETATDNFQKLDEKKKIGDLLIHNFLESDLNAPKIFSVSEVNIGFSSIHFYKIDNSYRLVYGFSEFSEKLEEGILNSISYIIENQSKISINGNLTPTSLYQTSFNDTEYEFLKKAILTNIDDIENTIGLLIGFNLNLIDELKQKRPNEMKQLLHKFINQTVESLVSTIETQINNKEITKFYFVLYLIPFENFELLTSFFARDN
ncbi:MAG: hypothetical protein JXA16_00785 [Bacteroidales bacterium]|nr:hypothetical protein [Bacteroidales bacterium]